MANSGTVTAGSAALASQYNNLRADVLNVSTGHTHTGASENGAKVAPTGISSGTAALNALLTADGSGGASFLALAAAGADVQEFTTSGSWVKPAGKSAVYVLAIGGGGGGAGGRRNTAGVYGSRGGNGGSHAARWIVASTLSGTVTVTIGAGGAGGLSAVSGSTDANGTAGSDGGATSFGTVISVIGGLGAVFDTSTDVIMTGNGAVEYGFLPSDVSTDATGRTSDTANTATKSFDPSTTANLEYWVQPGRGANSLYAAVRAMNRTGGGGGGGYGTGSGNLRLGGAGARGFGFNGTVADGGTAGANGSSASSGLGVGGGGGGGISDGTAGNGGDGYLGGGGGGGGAALRTTGNVKAGDGGTGGGGYILVVSV